MVEPPRFTEELIMTLMPLLAGSFPSLATMNGIVSGAAIVIGGFVAALPDRAARIWGSQRLAKSTPERRALLIGWYRILGVCVCFSGLLLAVNSLGY